MFSVRQIYRILTGYEIENFRNGRIGLDKKNEKFRSDGNFVQQCDFRLRLKELKTCETKIFLYRYSSANLREQNYIQYSFLNQQ